MCVSDLQELGNAKDLAIIHSHTLHFLPGLCRSSSLPKATTSKNRATPSLLTLCLSFLLSQLCHPQVSMWPSPSRILRSGSLGKQGFPHRATNRVPEIFIIIHSHAPPLPPPQLHQASFFPTGRTLKNLTFRNSGPPRISPQSHKSCSCRRPHARRRAITLASAHRHPRHVPRLPRIHFLYSEKFRLELWRRPSWRA